MTYLRRLWIALDILINVVLGGNIETMSSRMGRSIKEGKKCTACTVVCWLLSRFWPNHCINNIMDPLK